MLRPGWLLLHAFTIAAAITMVLLGRWQLHVSERKHFDIQNFGYTLQWWLFTGFALFLWGVVATTVPLIIGMYLAKYVFRFDDAIVLGIVSGARTTTASLGMVCDRAKSSIPGLGYTVTYAVGNTLLTIWGMVLVMMLT